MSDQVSDPYKTTGKIIIMCLRLYIFGWQTGTQMILHRMTAIISWLQSALNFFLIRILIC
jgi:hypothetical protein